MNSLTLRALEFDRIVEVVTGLAVTPTGERRLAELQPLESRCWRLLAERKGVADARVDEFRWLVEELRVSFFAQELRTPQPVSVKRLEKAWQQITQ